MQLLHIIEDLSDLFDNADQYDIVYFNLKNPLTEFLHKRLVLKL